MSSKMSDWILAAAASLMIFHHSALAQDDDRAVENPSRVEIDPAAIEGQWRNLRAAEPTAQIQYLLDRAEISDVITAYAYSVDIRDWELHRSLFTSTYEINTDGTFRSQTSAQRAEGFRPFFRRFSSTQHLGFPLYMDIRDTTAFAVATLHARHFDHDNNPNDNTLLFGQYEFWFARTDDGWKIARMAMVNRNKVPTASARSSAVP